MVHVQLVEAPAHPAESGIGIDHDRFRCVELFARRQRPAEFVRVQPAEQTGLSEKIDFGFD